MDIDTTRDLADAGLIDDPDEPGFDYSELLNDMHEEDRWNRTER
jgi:hypothetical protein